MKAPMKQSKIGLFVLTPTDTRRIKVHAANCNLGGGAFWMQVRYGAEEEG